MFLAYAEVLVAECFRSPSGLGGQKQAVHGHAWLGRRFAAVGKHSIRCKSLIERRGGECLSQVMRQAAPDTRQICCRHYVGAFAKSHGV